MRRLTDDQYRNVITDIFGEDIEYAGRFDPVLRPTHGLQVQGVSQIAVSPAGFEQYLVARYDIVWVACVVGKALIDDNTVCVTQGNGRGLGGEALPDQLKEAHPLFSGQLEDFSDVRITHGE